MDERTLQTVVYMLAVVGLFYFLILLPQRRQRKQTMEMLSALRPGDRVITAGGIIGTLVSVSDDEIEVRIADGVIVSMARSSVVSRRDEEKADE